MSEPTERMSVTLPRPLHAKIQSYRRARDPIPSTGQAVRELLARALEQEPRLEHEAAAPRKRGAAR